jgi:hypothetical protein
MCSPSSNQPINRPPSITALLSLPKTLTQAHLHEVSLTFKDALHEASLRRFREQKTHGPDVSPLEVQDVVDALAADLVHTFDPAGSSDRVGFHGDPLHSPAIPRGPPLLFCRRSPRHRGRLRLGPSREGRAPGARRRRLARQGGRTPARMDVDNDPASGDG